MINGKLYFSEVTHCYYLINGDSYHYYETFRNTLWQKSINNAALLFSSRIDLRLLGNNFRLK